MDTVNTQDGTRRGPLFYVGSAGLLGMMVVEATAVIGRHIGVPVMGAIELVQAASAAVEPQMPSPTLALVLSGLGVLVTAAAGYLGYTLVQTHHVGVEETPAPRRPEPAPRGRA